CAYVTDRKVLDVLLPTFEVFFKIIDGFRLTAEDHFDHAIRIELDDHVRAFIHHPDVVVLIYSHRVRERSAIVPRAPELDELQFFVELEELRSRPATRAAARTRAGINE